MSDNWSVLLANPNVVKLLKFLQSNVFKGLLMLALALWIATRLASLFWTGIGFMSNDAPAPLNFDSVGASTISGDGNVDIAAIKAGSIFGKGNQNKGGEVTEQKATNNSRNSGEIPNDAPKTNLPLTLTGLISAGGSPASRAMIMHSREEATFKLEDKLPPNKQAILVRVLPDRVILDNAGRYESLHLYDEEKQAAGRTQPSVNSESKSSVAERIAAAKNRIKSSASSSRRKQDAERQLKELIDNKDRTSLSKAIKVSIAQKDGQIQGYRVSPGVEPEMFAGLGFKSGDIIKAINGTPLNDPSNSTAMMAELGSASQFEITVERGGKDTNLTVNLP